MTRSALLNTDTEDLKELLGNGKHYVVPSYQRDYSWKHEHWEDLWDDLLAIEASQDDDHYMGSLVLEVGERKHFRIIAGQQRMATFSILILACIDYLHSLVEQGVDAVENSERAAVLERKYIGDKDPSSLRVTPKLKLNASDDDFFQLNLAQRKPPHGGWRTLRDSERLLWQCFEFFQKKINSKFSDLKSGEAVAQFVETILTERLVFISVRVQDQLSAYTVFETLNARGLELSETDLLKNYLLSLADRLSKSQIDPILRQWARITDRVGIARFPEFLRHHLNSQREYVRQKQLFKTIKRDIHSLEHVFALLDALEVDAAWFEALRDHSSGFWLDYDGAREQVRVLNLFNVSQFTPLILAAKDVLAPKDVTEVLRYCAVISVRFNGISRRSTHSLEEVYNSAALSMRSEPGIRLPAVRGLLKEIYIPDEEFEADFAVIRLKNRGRSAKRLRYLLVCLEKQLDPKELSDELLKATIEHILPENPEPEHWPAFTTEEHERYVDRLGNYALLEQDLNTRYAGNTAFAVKLPVYQQSHYKLARNLDEYPEWLPVAVDQRQSSMARVAKTIWRLEIPA